MDDESGSDSRSLPLIGMYSLIGLTYLAAFFYLVETLLVRHFDSIQTAVDVLSGLGSLVLVLLTAWYAYETRRIVTTERELRQEDVVEEWYVSTLSIVRQLTFEWEYLLAMYGDRDGVEFDEDGRRFRKLEELVRSLESEARRSPNGVEDDLIDSLNEFFREWRQLKSSNRVYIPHNSRAETLLLDIRSVMERSSERFGRE